MLATGLPAAYFVKDRVTPSRRRFVEWELFKDFRFVLLFIGGAVATFPLFVPPFFLPLYSTSIGLSSSTAAALVASFNFSSALGRIGCGFLSDRWGPLNTLAGSLLLNGRKHTKTPSMSPCHLRVHLSRDNFICFATPANPSTRHF